MTSATRPGEPVRAALRIDVDTLRGTRIGVPALRRQLGRHGIRATFFFSVGPDNMGRHLFRLLRPAFLAKMLRTRAPSLYGWDILLRGTLGPGPRIGLRAAEEIRACAADGHECGLHAWDHWRWQARIERMDVDAAAREIARGFEELERILGRAPECAAAPAWKCTDAVLEARARFPFRFNSDCRGDRVFLPRVGARVLAQPQVPVDLPTYDELLGREGVTDATYNEALLDRMRPGALNVLTIHAEVEGVARADLFADFLARAAARQVRFGPLGELGSPGGPVGEAAVVRRTIAGRDGWLAWQGPLGSTRSR